MSLIGSDKMVKAIISITIETKLRNRIDEELKKETCVFSSRSRLIEYHLISYFYPIAIETKKRADISVSKKES